MALFRQESQVGKDADLKRFAGSTLPTLEGHLQHVDNLTATGALKDGG